MDRCIYMRYTWVSGWISQTGNNPDSEDQNMNRKIDNVSFSINSYNFNMLADIGQLMASSATINPINWISFKDWGYVSINWSEGEYVYKRNPISINTEIDWNVQRSNVQSKDNPYVIGWVYNPTMLKNWEKDDGSLPNWSKVEYENALKRANDNAFAGKGVQTGWTDERKHSAKHYNIVNDDGWSVESEELKDHQYKDDIIKVLREWHTETDLICYGEIITDTEKENVNEEKERDWFMDTSTWDNQMTSESLSDVDRFLDSWAQQQQSTVPFNSGLKMADNIFTLMDMSHWKGGFNPKGFERHCKVWKTKRSIGMLELSKETTRTITNTIVKRAKAPAKRLTAKERERLWQQQFMKRDVK